MDGHEEYVLLGVFILAVTLQYTTPAVLAALQQRARRAARARRAGVAAPAPRRLRGRLLRAVQCARAVAARAAHAVGSVRLVSSLSRRTVCTFIYGFTSLEEGSIHICDMALLALWRSVSIAN